MTAPRGLAQAARALADGSVTPAALLDDALAAIARLDPELNAFITVDEAGARRQAEAATRRQSAGARLGPLDGAVVAVKDVIDVAGLPTTAGASFRRDGAAAADAEVIARLRGKGAVLIGKTHTHEFALGGTGANPHHGDARNPWDPRRITGGSSSGSAVAVATSMAHAALGTDAGGSVRGPASLCGVVGFKPSHGRVSLAGAVPSGWSLDHVGTLTVSVEDARLLLDAVSDAPRGGAATERALVADERRLVADERALVADERALVAAERARVAAERARVAIPANYFFDHLTPDVARVIDAALARARALGWDLASLRWPDTDLATAGDAVSWTLNSAEAAAYHRPWITTRPGDYGDDVRARLELGMGLLATEYLRAQRVRSLIGREFGRVFDAADVLVTPACPTTAFRHGTEAIDLGGVTMPAAGALNRCFRIANLTGWPAVTVPCGLATDGMPVALQFMGAHGDDERVLAVARAFEVSAAGGPYRPPAGGNRRP